MLELEEALSRILAALPEPADEEFPLREAHGRILSRPAVATIDLPGFDNSSMDGYAVRSADIAAAKAESPVRLRLVGRVAAGESFEDEIKPGECVRLFTGSPLPRGANAVVMQEDTRIEPGRDSEVLVIDSAKAWENVRFQGEDVKAGVQIAGPGAELSAGRVALCAAAGVARLHVGRRPVVGLLATGSELTEPGERLQPGKIYESNRLTLTPLIQQAGGVFKEFPIVPDTPEDTTSSLQRAFGECDLVVTCGGVSVGEMDFVKTAFEQLGGTLEFWKVAIKPGRPFVFGKRANKFLFGLPGNPVSALVTFLLLVRPALRRWQGAAEIGLPESPGILAEPLENSGRRRHFMRVAMDSHGRVRSSGIQASHILSSFAAANGLVDVPPETTLAEGAGVRVLRWTC